MYEAKTSQDPGFYPPHMVEELKTLKTSNHPVENDKEVIDSIIGKINDLYIGDDQDGGPKKSTALPFPENFLNFGTKHV